MTSNRTISGPRRDADILTQITPSGGGEFTPPSATRLFMSYPWFKLYGGDYLSDPKVRNFTAQEHSCWLHLLCYGSNSTVTGIVTHLTEEALMTYAGVNPSSPEWTKTSGVLARFEALGMIKIEGQNITILNWQKRQEALLSNAERQARFRARHKTLPTPVTQSNAIVTAPLQHSNDRIDKKRIDKIRTKTTPRKAATQSVAKYNALGAEIIKGLEAIDPKNKTYYGNTAQRAACDFLLKEYGLEEVLKRIRVLPKTNQLSYFPTITTPVQLRDKWVQLQDAVARKRGEVEAKKPKII